MGEFAGTVTQVVLCDKRRVEIGASLAPYWHITWHISLLAPTYADDHTCFNESHHISIAKQKTVKVWLHSPALEGILLLKQAECFTNKSEINIILACSILVNFLLLIRSLSDFMLKALSMFTLPSLITCVLNLQKRNSWAELTLLESRAAFFGGFCLNVLGVHMNSACLFLPPAAYCTNTQPWEDVGRQTVLRKKKHTHTHLWAVCSVCSNCAFN